MSASDALRRIAAVLQYVIAIVFALYGLLFMAAPAMHDEMGLGQSLRLPVIVVCVGAAASLAYGGFLSWRGGRFWWLPAILTMVAAPVLFVALWALAA